MLHRIGVLTKNEWRAIVRGLDAIGREIAAGKFKWRPELEDVHMNIEAELTRRVPAGAKLHTARSRNDQVALDMRLWLREEIISLLGEIADCSARWSCWARSMPTCSFPATRICNARSPFISRTICSPMWRCWSAIASGCGIATRA